MRRRRKTNIKDDLRGEFFESFLNVNVRVSYRIQVHSNPKTKIDLSNPRIWTSVWAPEENHDFSRKNTNRKPIKN